MKVVATKQGFDNLVVRNPGDVFDMPDNAFEKRPKLDATGKPIPDQFYDPPDWFEPVTEDRPPKKRGNDKE